MFLIVFGIHCNFFIVLPIKLKTCRSNGFLFFPKQYVCARKIGRISEVCRFVQAIDPIDLEFLGTNDVMILFKYINISNSYYAEDSLYLKHPQN